METKQYNPVEEFEKCLAKVFADCKRKFGVDMRASFDSDYRAVNVTATLTKQQEDYMLLRENE